MSLSYTALSRQALKASAAQRGTASSWPTQFAALWMVIRPSTPCKRLYFVSSQPFLPFPHAKVLPCVCRPYYAFCPDASLLPNLMKSSVICFSRCHKAKPHVVSYFYLLHNMIWRFGHLTWKKDLKRLFSGDLTSAFLEM